MNKSLLTVLLVFGILTTTNSVNAQIGGGLILPMPGQNQIKKANTQPAAKPENQTTQQTKQNGSTAGKNSAGKPNQAILPLPTTIKDVPEKPKNTTKPESSTQSEPQTLIAIPQDIPQSGQKSEEFASDDYPEGFDNGIEIISAADRAKSNSQSGQQNVAEPPQPVPSSGMPMLVDNDAANKKSDGLDDFGDSDFSVAPDEVTANTDSGVEDLLPPTPEEAKTTVAQTSNGDSLTVYPKDTGSAIFMVMKSWKCEDYDAASLLSQAAQVYGEESSDAFLIKDLDANPEPCSVTVEEEDITLDELLDIISAKSGRDWGADIPNKVIYIYPKGIKTESYVSW